MSSVSSATYQTAKWQLAELKVGKSDQVPRSILRSLYNKKICNLERKTKTCLKNHVKQKLWKVVVAKNERMHKLKKLYISEYHKRVLYSFNEGEAREIIDSCNSKNVGLVHRWDYSIRLQIASHVNLAGMKESVTTEASSILENLEPEILRWLENGGDAAEITSDFEIEQDAQLLVRL